MAPKRSQRAGGGGPRGSANSSAGAASSGASAGKQQSQAQPPLPPAQPQAGANAAARNTPAPAAATAGAAAPQAQAQVPAAPAPATAPMKLQPTAAANSAPPPAAPTAAAEQHAPAAPPSTGAAGAGSQPLPPQSQLPHAHAHAQQQQPPHPHAHDSIAQQLYMYQQQLFAQAQAQQQLMAAGAAAAAVRVAAAAAAANSGAPTPAPNGAGGAAGSAAAPPPPPPPNDFATAYDDAYAALLSQQQQQQPQQPQQPLSAADVAAAAAMGQAQAQAQAQAHLSPQNQQMLQQRALLQHHHQQALYRMIAQTNPNMYHALAQAAQAQALAQAQVHANAARMPSLSLVPDDGAPVSDAANPNGAPVAGAAGGDGDDSGSGVPSPSSGVSPTVSPPLPPQKGPAPNAHANAASANGAVAAAINPNANMPVQMNALLASLQSMIQNPLQAAHAAAQAAAQGTPVPVGPPLPGYAPTPASIAQAAAAIGSGLRVAMPPQHANPMLPPASPLDQPMGRITQASLDSTFRALEQEVETQLPKLGRDLPQVRDRELQIKQWVENKSASAKDKLDALADFCSLETENRVRSEHAADLWKHKCFQFKRDQQHFYLQLQRATKLKERLEGLCRELQRRNKVVTEEMRLVSLDQQRQHKEMKEKFEHSLEDVSKQLSANSGSRESTAELKEKLAQLLRLESLRDQHYNHELRTKEIELKLCDAKLRQQIEFAAAEHRKARIARDKLEELTQTEHTLRSQLTGYAEKFEQVQATLSKSNDLFGTFKAEMEKMSKQMKKLEKEKLALEQKNSASQLTIIQMFEERTQDRKQIERIKRQKQKLETLCRLLEKERAKNKGAAGALAGSTGAGLGAGVADDDKDSATVAATVLEDDSAGQADDDVHVSGGASVPVGTGAAVVVDDVDGVDGLDQTGVDPSTAVPGDEGLHDSANASASATVARSGVAFTHPTLSAAAAQQRLDAQRQAALAAAAAAAAAAAPVTARAVPPPQAPLSAHPVPQVGGTQQPMLPPPPAPAAAPQQPPAPAAPVVLTRKMKRAAANAARGTGAAAPAPADPPVSAQLLKAIKATKQHGDAK